MKIRRQDKRGIILELFRGNFSQCNLMQMKKGSAWGNHYHKKTREYFYLIKGQIKVNFQDIKTKKKISKIIKSGHDFTVMTYILHTIEVQKSSLCLVLYSQKFQNNHPDHFYL